MDNVSNNSVTDTVSIIYTPMAGLTVSTTGQGNVSPNYNGSLLQIGQTYKMTATAVNGFMFTNWTGGISSPSSTYTNGPTVQFVMANNLVMQANFVDTNKPFLSITNITPGMQVTSAPFTVMGVSTDNVAVANVYFSLDGAPAQTATINGKSWSASLPLNPGSNTLSAYAVDGSGNVSATATVLFDYVVTTPLTVQTNGQGIISPNDNGSQLRSADNLPHDRDGDQWIPVQQLDGLDQWDLNAVHERAERCSSRCSEPGHAGQFRGYQQAVPQHHEHHRGNARRQRILHCHGRGHGQRRRGQRLLFVRRRAPCDSGHLRQQLESPVFHSIRAQIVSRCTLRMALAMSRRLATVIFDYVVSAPLTVQTNGQGIISPNYNGSLLQVGGSVFHDRHGDQWISFSNWTAATNGNFTTYTNGPTVQFTMLTNLVMQANFVDTNKPFVSITNITAGMHVGNGSFTAMGVATDNVAVASVQYSLNGASFVTATVVGNSWSSVPLSLNPGSNSLAVYATDTSGNVSATATVIFDYVVSATLTVQTNGDGIISPNYNGSLLQIGSLYSMTATAINGFPFSSWTGSTNGNFTTYTNGQTVQFTMFTNLVMQANFVDTNNPFVSITNLTAGMHVGNGNSRQWALPRITSRWPACSIRSTARTSPRPHSPGTLVLGALSRSIRAPISCGVCTDSSGNVSATATVSFDYVVSTPLTVQTNG